MNTSLKRRVIQSQSEHPQVAVAGQEYLVDELVVHAVVAMNHIPHCRTLSSCQGEPGIIGDGGMYGHIAFEYGVSWQDLSQFCFVDLKDKFSEWIDDEVRIDIFANSKPYAWLCFRSEMLPTVTIKLRDLAFSEHCSHAISE